MTVEQTFPLGRLNWIARPFPILFGFLVMIFLTGGSSWPYEAKLMILRPVAVLVVGWGLYTVRIQHLLAHKSLLALFLGVVGLTFVHLVPLPNAWWSNMPGRQLIVGIDSAMGFGKVARPLSMQPDATLNALVSLIVPLAVLVLAIQLTEKEQRKIASLLLGFVAVSGVVGLLQLSGVSIYLYEQPLPGDAPGLFNNRNHQGALLALVFPLGALARLGGFGWPVRATQQEFVALAVAVVTVPLVVATGSRSGLFVSLIAVCCVLPLLLWSGDRQMSNKRRTLALGLAVAVLMGMIWLTTFLSRDLAFERLERAGNDLRFPLWASIVDAIPDFMPWGSGIGTYADAYQIIEPDALLRPTYSNHAHNEWLEIAFTAGLPGIMLILLALLAVLVWGFRAARGGWRESAMARVGLIIILVLAIASTTDYPVRTPIMSAVFTLAAVWASAAGRCTIRRVHNRSTQ